MHLTVILEVRMGDPAKTVVVQEGFIQDRKDEGMLDDQKENHSRERTMNGPGGSEENCGIKSLEREEGNKEESIDREAAKTFST